MIERSPDSNPFSTRFVRPAAVEYWFEGDDDLPALLSRLEGHGGWGEIVGPHGTGKTTLLGALRRELEARGRRIASYELHEGQRRLPAVKSDSAWWNESTTVIVDGYEQLSWWSRLRLKAACRRSGSCLLVTSHADVGLPLLYRTRPSLGVVQALVARLMEGHRPLIAPADVEQAFSAAGGNVRETLFRLYDQYQQRGSSGPS